MQTTQCQRKPIHAAQWEADKSLIRIRQLVTDGYTYEAMAQLLQTEGYRTIQGKLWTAVNLRQLIFKLRADSPSWYASSARWAKFTPPTLH
jgi:hypothetical protein